MTENNKNIIINVVFVVVCWYVVGAFLFPFWWYKFIFLGDFSNLNFYKENNLCFIIFGFSVVFIYFLLISIKINVAIIKLSTFNIQSLFIVILLLLLASARVYYGGKEISSNLNELSELMKIAHRTDPTDYGIDDFFRGKKLIDLLYINIEKIDNLYIQITSHLQERKRIIEKSSATTQSAEIGIQQTATVAVRAEEINENKETREYEAVADNIPTKIINIVSFLLKNNDINIYETVELSSDDIKQLKQFVKIAQKYSIAYDNLEHNKALDQAEHEAFTKKEKEFEKLSKIVLLSGEHKFLFHDGKITVSKDYCLGQKIKIYFIFDDIPVEQVRLSLGLDNVKSEKVETIKAYSLVRVRTTNKSANGDIELNCDPYAIFYK